MTIRVACGCGKKFQAKDHLAGKRVKCPACGGVLVIGHPEPELLPAADPMASESEESSMFDDLPMPRSSDGSGVGQLGPARAPQKKSNAGLIIGVAGGGAAVVIVLLVVALIVALSGGGSTTGTGDNDSVAQLPEPPRSTPTDTVSNQPVPEPPRPIAVPPRPSPVSDQSANTANSDSGDHDSGADDSSDGDSSASDDSESESKSISLSASITKWHGQSSTALYGSRPPKDMEADVVEQHFSWMTGLLPFLGRDDLHARFNFDLAWNKNPNLQLAVTAIPEFLNPHDDRKRWEGYPFQNIALTHFVGMSGIEDRRNVVAAKLKRSEPGAGIFGYGEVARPKQITDGLGQTIMIIGSGEGIQAPWVQGGGATIRGAREPYFNELSGFGSRGLKTKGAMVMFADGSARTLTADIDPTVFRAMCTIHGGETVDVSKNGEPLARIGGESTEEERAGGVRVLEVFVRERSGQ